jgi:hypothetical protein
MAHIPIEPDAPAAGQAPAGQAPPGQAPAGALPEPGGLGWLAGALALCALLFLLVQAFAGDDPAAVVGGAGTPAAADAPQP